MTEPAAPLPNGLPASVLATYRYLRLILLLPALFLLLATVLEAVSLGHLRDSISDYYQGPVRDVFVGALMASGVCMIMYKGQSKLEDYALNFAGFNAFFVALVPNNFTEALAEAPAQSPDPTDILTKAQLLDNLKLVLIAFLIAAVLFVVLDGFLMKWTQFRLSDQTRLAIGLVFASWLFELLFIAIVIALLVGRETVFGLSIFGVVHFAAAGLLIANLSFAAASHAWPGKLRTAADAPAEGPGERIVYIVIAALMWAGLIIGGWLIYRQVQWSVIGTEWLEILLFAAFWFTATRRSWTPQA